MESQLHYIPVFFLLAAVWQNWLDDCIYRLILIDLIHFASTGSLLLTNLMHFVYERTKEKLSININKHRNEISCNST